MDAIISESDKTEDDDTGSRLPLNVDVRAPKPGQRKKQALSNLSQKHQAARKESLLKMRAGQEMRPAQLDLEP